jgi:hypothetical protein
MIVKHDRAFPIVVGRCPNVEKQAILGRIRFVSSRRLNSRWPWLKGFPNACPGLQGSRSAKSSIPRNASGIRNPLKDIDPLASQSTNLPVANGYVYVFID